jgi:hypothetical protein
VNLLEALNDPALFAGVMAGPTWSAWKAALKALFGLPLAEDELRLYQRCTGREEGPERQCGEFWAICGRRAGKTYVISVVATWLAFCKDYSAYRQPGEPIVIMLVAGDRAQARQAFRYVTGLIRGVPMLARQVIRETAEEVELASGVLIEVASNSYRLIRGRTVAALLADEAAFWHAEGLNPADEVLAAARPAMLSIPGSLMMVASTPYARKGPVWQAYKRWWGRPDPDVLVWSAPSLTMNPSLPARLIAAAYEADPADAASEYGAEFRTDVGAFVAREIVEALVDVGTFERLPEAGRKYSAFTDPSGGSADSFTLAISHVEGETVVLDCLREREPPFAPETVVAEFSGVSKSYGCTTVVGDKYAGEWPREQFKKRGIVYETSTRTKSEIYLESLPLINGGRVDLLDNSRLVNQVCGLERRVARGGRDSIDHAPHGHDDLANAALGALLLCQRSALGPSYGFAPIVLGWARRDPRADFPWTVEGAIACTELPDRRPGRAGGRAWRDRRDDRRRGRRAGSARELPDRGPLWHRTAERRCGCARRADRRFAAAGGGLRGRPARRPGGRGRGDNGDRRRGSVHCRA